MVVDCINMKLRVPEHQLLLSRPMLLFTPAAVVKCLLYIHCKHLNMVQLHKSALPTCVKRAALHVQQQPPALAVLLSK
jgi:hypothetical protein